MHDRETIPFSNTRPTHQLKRESERLSNCQMWMAYVPPNKHSSQGEFQLYIFEDIEAVIEMIIKSPRMRHVSRTHRVALDWLEPKIQIKYVDTKTQLADMLTYGVSRVTSGTIFFVCST